MLAVRICTIIVIIIIVIITIIFIITIIIAVLHWVTIVQAVPIMQKTATRQPILTDSQSANHWISSGSRNHDKNFLPVFKIYFMTPKKTKMHRCASELNDFLEFPFGLHKKNNLKVHREIISSSRGSWWR